MGPGAEAVVTGSFFLPGFEENAEEVYALIRRNVEEVMRTDLAPDTRMSRQRIRALEYVHDGRRRRNVVGESDEDNGETVVAIFFEPLRSLYHVVTASRGGRRGTLPLHVGNSSVHRVEDFAEMAPGPEPSKK
jgi:hypothetical protein